MKSSVVLLAFVFAIPFARAERLGNTIEVAPVSGWASAPVDATPVPVPIPTIKFAPKDDRNAAVLISLFPADAVQVADADSLAQFFHALCGAFGDAAKTAKINTLQLPDGTGIYASFEDPDLIGKPVQKGNYKWATAVCTLLGKRYVLQATIFSDGVPSADFKEGLEIIRGAKVIATPPPKIGPAERSTS